MQSELDLYTNELQSFTSDGPSRQRAQASEEKQTNEQMKAKIEAMKEYRIAVTAEIDKVDQQKKQLEDLYEYYWEQIRALDVHVKMLHTESHMVSKMINFTAEGYSSLKRTNVYDDTFNIYYDGHFGTINETRLGRLPSIPVDPMDVNSALGQVVHLIQGIAQLFPDFQFSKYELFSKGSFSKIAKRGDTPCEL
jgi:beclin 1